MPFTPFDSCTVHSVRCLHGIEIYSVLFDYKFSHSSLLYTFDIGESKLVKQMTISCLSLQVPRPQDGVRAISLVSLQSKRQPSHSLAAALTGITSPQLLSTQYCISWSAQSAKRYCYYTTSWCSSLYLSYRRNSPKSLHLIHSSRLRLASRMALAR